jgi:hypothetical protein
VCEFARSEAQEINPSKMIGCRKVNKYQEILKVSWRYQKIYTRNSKFKLRIIMLCMLLGGSREAKSREFA